MISIKKFLGAAKPEPADYIRFLQLLLKGISLHAVQASESDLTRFRQEVSDISGKLGVQSTADEIAAAIGFVVRAVTGYNRMAARITQAHVQELQAMFAMTTRTIAFLSDNGKTGVEQLNVIERNLHHACSISDVRVLRGKLNDCLALVRSESNRLRDESQARILELKEAVARTANHAREAGIELPEQPARATPSNDPLTGLQGRIVAEERIASHIAQGREFVVAVFLVDGLTQVAARYGPETADEILLAVTRNIEERLETASLFRWSGSALAAILEIETSFPAVERRMQEIASLRLEKTIEQNSRSVLLPITCSLIVQKVSDADSVENVMEILDDFVAARSSAA